MLEFNQLEPYQQFFLVILILLILGTALRLVTRLARRLLSCGCLGILLLGGVVLLANFIQQFFA
jgi:hypothetical protein